MANLPESSIFDAGIYQLETGDPVVGGAAGIANSQGKSLANRTRYLKDAVDAINAALASIASLASPVFTGDPKAPTPALGDNDTSVATTEFVQKTVGGYLSKNVAGGSNVTLTAVEAGNAIIALSGVLTANIQVVVPVSPTRAWLIKNSTSGAYTVTVKTAAGTGVVVTQGKTSMVWTDGTNAYDFLADYGALTQSVADATYAKLAAAQAFTKAQRCTPVALPVTTGNVNLDFSLSNHFGGQVTGNVTFSNSFTNAQPGQSGIIRVQQDAATLRSWAFGSYWKYVGGSSQIPGQTQAANAYDEIIYHIHSATEISFHVRSDVK